uniref:Uncharacterized protein n=1 Tax=Alexandrium catenella TaxID=2925 RepID=A0A7S1WKI8_ALECA
MLPLLPAAGALQLQPEGAAHRAVNVTAASHSATKAGALDLLALISGVEAARADELDRAVLGSGLNASASKIIVLPEEPRPSEPAGSVSLRDGGGSHLSHAQPAAWSVGYWESTMSSCRYIFGFPKFAWALLCDVLSLTLVLLCIPLLLTCSRRRPPGAPLFDCSFSGSEQGSLKQQAPWQS